jgi:hypothetical protein
MDEESDDARQEAQRVNAVTAAFIAKRPIPAAQPKLRALAPRILCPPEERALASMLMTRVEALEVMRATRVGRLCCRVSPVPRGLGYRFGYRGSG